jgi:hypothetical protein
MSAEFPSDGTMATVVIDRPPLTCAKFTFCEVAHPEVSTTVTNETAIIILRMGFPCY